MYPVTLKASAKMVDEIHGCEYGSYEDAISGNELCTRSVEHHIVTVIERRKAKTGITLQCDAETEDLIYALKTGTTSMYRDVTKLLDAAERVLEGKDPYPETTVPKYTPSNPKVNEGKWSEFVWLAVEAAIELKLIRAPGMFRKMYRTPISRGERARGGMRKYRPLIQLSAGEWQIGNKTFKEYDSFNHDPEIGAIKVDTDDDVTLLIALHETAHAIDYWHIKRYGSDSRGGHGSEFKHYYRQLRRYFGYVKK